MKSHLKCITFIFLLFSTIKSYGQVETVIIPSNRSTGTLEKNILFHADQRYTITQSGSASLPISVLFDGVMSPFYSSVNPADPYILTIENFPSYHTQGGAWIGWSTRYYHPIKFKIEVYNIYNGASEWVTITDVDNYNENSYMIGLPQLQASKLRFTFYTGNGPGGAIGLSEIFYLHPEAASAYNGLLVDYNHYGNVAIGTSNANADKRLTIKTSINQPVGLYVGPAENNNSYVYLDRRIGRDGGIIWTIDGAPAWQQTNNDSGEMSWFSYNKTTGAATVLTFDKEGNMGIGTETPTEKLSVNGKIRAKEIKVESANWPDYVFEKDYDIGKLETLESYIKANKHLPEVPSAKDVTANGVELGEMNKILLKKIEELTLHLIEKDKAINQLLKRVQTIEEKIKP